jgi:opacity protein-like surface antigen
MTIRLALATAAAAAAFTCTAANAQVLSADLFADDVSSDMSAPSYFDGLYAGVLIGMSGADHKNFFPTGGIDRYGVGAVVGYNTYLAPRVVVGAEVQGHLDTDFAGTYNTGAFAFGKLGFTTADNLMVYLLGGGGVFDQVPAWAFGLGLEWGVYENLSLRADITTIGQAGPAPSGISIPGITAWIIKGGALWHFGEGSSSVPPFSFALNDNGQVTDFDGPYAGVGYGMHYNAAGNFFPDVGFGAHITRGNIGAFGGYNFKLVDDMIDVVASVEVQVDFLFDTSGDTGWEALGLARLGVVPVDGLLLYAAAGGGMVNNKTAYALGGGAEYALWGNASLRAEYLALGEPSGGGFSGHKGTIGAVWHID